MARFRVSVKGFSVQAFVDSDGGVHHKRPVSVLYRPDKRATNAAHSVISQDEWYTEAELAEYGITSIPKTWLRHRRPRTDLPSFQFRTAVIEASDDVVACREFEKLFQIEVNNRANWSVEPTEDPVGLYDPIKMNDKTKALIEDHRAAQAATE